MARRRGTSDGSKEAFWRGVVMRQAGSGLSIREWCRRQGVNEPAFYWWRRRLHAQQSGRAVPRHSTPAGSSGTNVEPPATTADFLPIHLASSAMIEIVLTDGVRLQVPFGVTTDQLRQVLCALRAAAC